MSIQIFSKQLPSAKTIEGRVFLYKLFEVINYTSSNLQQPKAIPKKSKWLFPSETGKTHVRGESIAKAVRRSDETLFLPAKIKRFTPHDLRCTAATHMTALGISRLIVSKILNHTDSSITTIYDRHTYDAGKREALDRWGNELNRIIHNTLI